MQKKRVDPRSESPNLGEQGVRHRGRARQRKGVAQSPFVPPYQSQSANKVGTDCIFPASSASDFVKFMGLNSGRYLFLVNQQQVFFFFLILYKWYCC